MVALTDKGAHLWPALQAQDYGRHAVALRAVQHSNGTSANPLMPIYDHKIPIVLSGDLLDWQELNVTAFLANSAAIQFPETHGQALVTASKSAFLPFLKHPILVYRAEGPAEVRKAFERARERGATSAFTPGRSLRPRMRREM
ncbi:DUF2000 family protein [Hymenobacter bucti]|uniref:DUF2000 family protein n=1 Tax=Hymenobacter bucti TaxID=1844114 RepID=A0ABW4R1J8_9BACT